jgi:nucleoside-diphosphate-sugar epimerase
MRHVRPMRLGLSEHSAGRGGGQSGWLRVDIVSPRRVLVTGALGSIGEAVVQTLAMSGDEVVGLDVREPCGDRPFREFVRADVANTSAVEDALERVQAAIHLAAWVHRDVRSERDRADVFRFNQAPTEWLAARCAAMDKRLVFISTVAVHGENVVGTLTEEAPRRPDTAYAQSKDAGERAVLARGGIVLRLPMAYGAGDRGNMARMIRAVNGGWFVVPGMGEVRRTFVGRWNVAEAVRLALRADIGSRVFLVTDDETTTLGAVVDLIADLAGKRRPRRVAKPVVAAAALVGSIVAALGGRSMPVSLAAYRKLTRDLAFDGTRIRSELGYRPVRTLREGLEEEVRWCLSSAP